MSETLGAMLGSFGGRQSHSWTLREGVLGPKFGSKKWGANSTHGFLKFVNAFDSLISNV